MLIRGQRAPVIGKVTMNTLMVDGSAINGALLADLYTVWGNSNPKILKGRWARRALQPTQHQLTGRACSQWLNKRVTRGMNTYTTNSTMLRVISTLACT